MCSVASCQVSARCLGGQCGRTGSLGASEVLGFHLNLLEALEILKAHARDAGV